MHRHHVQVGFERKFLVEQARQFAHAHAVADGDGVETNEGSECRIQHIAFHGGAANGIGAIEHNEWQAAMGAGGHAQAHGVEVGIEADADILDIEDQSVQVLQHGLVGLAPLPIEAVGQNSGLAVARGVHGDAVGGIAADAVLWSKELHQFDVLDLVQLVGCGPQARVDTRGICDQPQALAGNQGEGCIQKSFVAQDQAFFRLL